MLVNPFSPKQEDAAMVRGMSSSCLDCVPGSDSVVAVQSTGSFDNFSVLWNRMVFQLESPDPRLRHLGGKGISWPSSP
jgi:hypothetical protein